ncbi:MAG TPA: FkbM family methyltransferase [Burkholderiaceae bacterium]|nr:FkbM family methyltransferase [Burkholderiaceae bacterium]
MKLAHGWHFPNGEKHMIDWLAEPKNKLILNGRESYQGKKQVAAIAHCTNRRVAVDIGSHIGLWTHNLAAAFESVQAFEPVAAHRECFTANIHASNVELNACALGHEMGMVNIWSNPTSSGDSWVSGTGDIPMHTLDSFELECVDLLKIDCEGFELNVLRGAVETIARCKPVICVEQKRDMAVKFGLKPQGAIEFLQSRGYRVAEVLSGDYIMVPA